MRLSETRTVPTTPREAFAFTADFSNIPKWDPGVASAVRLDAGPIGVGSEFDLEVKFGSTVSLMRYQITEHQPDYRVVLVGEGRRVKAVDEITFTPTEAGTRIDYMADIRFKGILRLATPLFRGTLGQIGVKAADGLAKALTP